MKKKSISLLYTRPVLPFFSFLLQFFSAMENDTDMWKTSLDSQIVKLKTDGKRFSRFFFNLGDICKKLKRGHFLPYIVPSDLHWHDMNYTIG